MHAHREGDSVRVDVAQPLRRDLPIKTVKKFAQPRDGDAEDVPHALAADLDAELVVGIGAAAGDLGGVGRQQRERRRLERTAGAGREGERGAHQVGEVPPDVVQFENVRDRDLLKVAFVVVEQRLDTIARHGLRQNVAIFVDVVVNADGVEVDCAADLVERVRQRLARDGLGAGGGEAERRC